MKKTQRVGEEEGDLCLWLLTPLRKPAILAEGHIADAT